MLSKWVGESERQFDCCLRKHPNANRRLFSDEIDGLAPVRSSKSDQIHNSRSRHCYHHGCLDNRGRVVVLGATNRVDPSTVHSEDGEV